MLEDYLPEFQEYFMAMGKAVKQQSPKGDDVMKAIQKKEEKALSKLKPKEKSQRKK